MASKYTLYDANELMEMAMKVENMQTAWELKGADVYLDSLHEKIGEVLSKLDSDRFRKNRKSEKAAKRKRDTIRGR